VDTRAPLAIMPRLSVRPRDGHIRQMNDRAAQSDVVRFLRAALADGAHAVTKLEASARAAGLLTERERITGTRAFRRAKESLGIRSLQSRSQWLWELPREAERSTKAARKTASLPRIPSDWIEGIARLNPDRSPSDVPRHRWRQFVDDCKNFMSPSESWAERAAQLGWDSMTLFGCAPRRPLDHSGSAGLLWAINGGRLVELHRDWAVIDVPLQARQRIFYRRNVKPGKISLPWVKQMREVAGLRGPGPR
jgi:hypothetical protein